MQDHLESALDLRHLRVLHLLLTSSSVSRTADMLGQSQPAVSATLRRLREIIGDPLLVRSGSHMVPTERGAALAPVVQRVLDAVGSITEPTETFDPRTSQRHLRVAAATCFGPFFIPRISQIILDQAPGMTVEYCATPSDAELMHGLEEGEIDVVIGNWPTPPESLRHTPLLTTTFVCVMRRDHPLAGRRAIDMRTYLTLDHLSPTPISSATVSPVDGRLKALHLRRRIAISVPEYTVAPSILARTDLVFTTGRPFAEHLASSMPLALSKAPPEFGPMSFYMLWHERSHASPCNRWLRGLIRSVGDEIEAFGQGAEIRSLRA